MICIYIIRPVYRKPATGLTQTGTNCFDPVRILPRNNGCEGHDMTKLNLINLGLIALLLAIMAVHTAGAGTAVWPEPVVLPFISS
jgi:hypothetical protein